MAPKVWDAFLFGNELDLLEARLAELDPVVDRFVLAEAAVTHQGGPKPLYYAENRSRFSAWADKIVHVVADLPDAGDDLWARENAQRNAISQGLGDLGPDDILLLSDVDEIPFPHVVRQAPGHVLCMRNHILAVNLLDPGWWPGTVGRFGRDVPGRLQDLRDGRHSDVALRDKFGLSPLTAGWHFSWLGGPQAMRDKARLFVHVEDQEHVLADAEHMYAEKKCYVQAERHLLEVVMDDKWPRYMQDRKGPAVWYWPGDGSR